MDSEVVTTEAPVIPQPEPVVVPEPKPLEMEEFVHKQYEQKEAELAAAESKPDTPAEPEGDNTAEAKPAEPAAEPKTEPEAPPFTEEELRDPAFLGRLDSDGWKKLEKFSPSIHKMAKAVAHAQGKVSNQLRELETGRSRPEPEAKEEPKTDPYEEALAKTDSLDPAERAEGFRTLARLEARKLLGEIGIDPIETQASAAERAAYRLALQGMPQLAELPDAELDAAVEADPDLMDDIQLAISLQPEARTRLLAKVMTRAGKIVLNNRSVAKAAADAAAAKQAKDAKDSEAQKRLRSNQTNVSTDVVVTPNGKSPKGEKTIEESIHEKVVGLKLA